MFWNDLQERISRYGMAIQYVMGTPTRPAWAYTVGRLRKGQPELVVVGLDPESAAVMLNSIDRAWDAIDLRTDGICELPSAPFHRFGVVEIPDALWDSEYLSFAQRDAVARGLIGQRRALQIVWLDDDGAPPWDPDADPHVRRCQPILGLLDGPPG